MRGKDTFIVFSHRYTIAQVAHLWGCSEETIEALVANGTIPTHQAYLGVCGPLRLDGGYVDRIAPDARKLNKNFDDMMGGPGWQERKKQEREQIEQHIARIQAQIEDLRQEGVRQQQAFQQQLSEIMDSHTRHLYQQITQSTGNNQQEMKQNDE